MSILATTDLVLPHDVASGMIRKAQDGSAIAKLAPSEAFRFGNTDFVTINGVPKAQFVDEGGEKASTTAGFDFVTAKPRKAQVTMRFNQEVMWADEDHQLGVLDTLASLGAEAMARAIDLGTIHGLNPHTGVALSGSPASMAASAKTITAGADPDLDIEAAIGLLITDDQLPTGIAFDPSLAYSLSTQRDAQGKKVNPEMSLNPRALTSYAGLSAAVGDTVSATREATVATKVRAVVGDFSAGVRWGVARTLPVELIQYGDPDGQGDLKALNQIALRLETVFVWYVDPAAFSVIKAA